MSRSTTHRKTGLRLHAAKNLCGEDRVWIDIGGNSYAGTASPESLANWLQAKAIPWLRQEAKRMKERRK